MRCEAWLLDLSQNGTFVNRKLARARTHTQITQAGGKENNNNCMYKLAWHLAMARFAAHACERLRGAHEHVLGHVTRGIWHVACGSMCTWCVRLAARWERASTGSCMTATASRSSIVTSCGTARHAPQLQLVDGPLACPSPKPKCHLLPSCVSLSPGPVAPYRPKIPPNS